MSGFLFHQKKIPYDLEKYKLLNPPERMHDPLYYATMLYGESAILGTPAIYLNYIGKGYTNELEKYYGAVFSFSESFEDQE